MGPVATICHTNKKIYGGWTVQSGKISIKKNNNNNNLPAPHSTVILDRSDIVQAKL